MIEEVELATSGAAEPPVEDLDAQEGIVTTKSPDESQRLLTDAAPFSICYSLHVNMIQHGRQRCHSRGPVCAGCPVQDTCKSAGVS